MAAGDCLQFSFPAAELIILHTSRDGGVWKATTLLSQAPSLLLLIAHLTPGGGVPVETRPMITGHLGQWPGGHGSAVKRSQGPLISHVETLDLSWFSAAFTILWALKKDTAGLLFRLHAIPHSCRGSDSGGNWFHCVVLMVFIFIVMSSADVMDGGEKCPLRSKGVIFRTDGKAYWGVTVVGKINKTDI